MQGLARLYLSCAVSQHNYTDLTVIAKAEIELSRQRALVGPVGHERGGRKRKREKKAQPFTNL